MSYQFPRGFKQGCEQTVVELRRELELADTEPINMDQLAKHLCISMTSLGSWLLESEYPGHDQHVAEVYDKVSALTFFEGRRRHFVYNERHKHPRHRSNLAHEFAHALLQHPPEGEEGCVARDKAHEAEAGWLSGVLMLPDFQAILIARTSMPLEVAMEQFELSREMLVYRLRITGALKRFPQYLKAA